MKIQGLDGREYNLKLSNTTRTTVSKPHFRMRQLLAKLFPLEHIYEEVTLLGTRTNKRPSLLFADFIIPSLKMVIEVDGGQHDEYNKFFHEDKAAYYKAVARDRDKSDWCDINGITLVRVKQKDSDEEWQKQIMGQ